MVNLIMHYRTRHSFLTVSRINTTTFELSRNYLDILIFENERTDATSTILAYRPRYNLDKHETGLGAIFLNLDGLFPCIANSDIIPICRRFTRNEDGFFKGKTITEAADRGDDMKIFGNGIKTYGFVFESCPYLHTYYGCYPDNFQIVITCFVPRSCL